jgi:formylglycine-generating enzyme required for sulfatase activity
MPIPSPIIDQIIQALTKAVWDRPELTRLREPIEGALQAGTFRHLTTQAFETFATQITSDLPQYFDAGFIQMPQVQVLLVDYIVKGKAIDLGQLTHLYGKRHLNPAGAPSVAEQINGYLVALRETFAADPTYAPILLARDAQAMIGALNALRGEMHERFDQITALVYRLLADPEFRAVVERRTGTHVFLSYSSKNAVQAIKIRNSLQDAGHRVWQDVTSLVGGEDWQKSIVDGIKRAYAMVLVMSHQSNESHWVNEEFLLALDLKKRIVPIRIDDCDIFGKRGLHIVSGQSNLEDGITGLIQALPTPKPDEDMPTVAKEAKVDRRKLEEDYLAILLSQYRVWKTVYTPMAGVGQMRVEDAEDDEIEMIEVGGVTIATEFDLFIDERLKPHSMEQKLERREYKDDILRAIEDMRQLVILGDPGAGKSTTLWRIVADYAEQAKKDPSRPLPVFIRLGEIGAGETVEEKIRIQLGELGEFYSTLLSEKRLALLFDGLNELPEGNRDRHIVQIKTLIEHCQKDDLIAAVTCRELDYTGALDMGIPERLIITPLDPIRIRQFANSYIQKPPGKGDELFWQLAGEGAKNCWQGFVQWGEIAEEQQEQVFWLADSLPDDKNWGWHSIDNRHWEAWQRERHHPRSMLTLGSNPFMLYMMTQVFTKTKRIPQNRGVLFGTFVDFLLMKREKMGKAEADRLKAKLGDLGYQMQKQGQGTSVDQAEALMILGDEQSLYRAKSANLLTGSETLRFTHQLLQEYFAAHKLDMEMKSGVPATTFWRRENWWQPNQWNETAVLLAGLYSDDTTPVIEWLKDANPELTSRCILESGAQTPHTTIDLLRHDWLPRLRDFKRDPKAQARAAVGRALGVLKLDNRRGVSVIYIAGESIPDIDWVQIPTGKFWMGSNKSEDPDARDNETPQHEVFLPEYLISRYPITNAQFSPFILDAGYERREFWTEAGWRVKEQEGWAAPRYWNVKDENISNHPVGGVSWYECYAFTRWLNGKYRQYSDVLGSQPSEIRLPTESEWEKAARGTDKRFYPYGNIFDPEKDNVRDTGILRPSAVGIFPNAALFYGVQEMSGNVWEWCLTQWRESYKDKEDNSIESTNSRVLRGGAYGYDADWTRCTYRHNFAPHETYDLFSFRVVGISIP